MQKMLDANIDTRPFFHPLSSLPAYKHLSQAAVARERNTNAYRIAACGINLPSGFNMTPECVRYVCERLKEFLPSLS